MSREWKEEKLENCTVQIFSGGTPSTKIPEYWNGIYPWLSSGETRNAFITTTEKTITEEGIEKSSTKLAQKYDVVIASAGQGNTRGQASLCKIDTYINQSIIAIRSKRDILEPNYLFYNIQGRYNELRKISDGHSIRGSLTTKIIKDLKIMLPPLEEQKTIANILSTLDEKIEVNNQINKKLEEMAQTIFKHWFVDFEFPNGNGEPYKSSGGEMVDSEFGMIPKGWEVGTFREYVDTLLGGDWGKENSQGNYNKEVYCIRGADIPEVRIGKRGQLPSRYILEKNYRNKRLNQGDLVIEISGGSPTQSTGRITYINDSMLKKYDKDFVCTNFCRAITLKNKYHMEYFYYYWTYLYNLDVFFQYENGTTGIKNLDINAFMDTFTIAKPNQELILEFHRFVSILLKSIQFIGSENDKLEEIRDTLLPKLMSGELRVPLEEGDIS